MNAETVLRVLVEEARPLILDGWKPDSCAISTRVALDVCRAFGVTAKPLAVGALAFNAEAWPLRDMPMDDWPASAWSIGVDPDDGGQHVVALVEGATLLDLSADQFDRPEKDLRVPGPVAARVPPEFLAGGYVGLTRDDGTRLLYRRGGSLDWLRRSPDWTERRRRTAIVGDLVRRVRAGAG